MSIRKHTTYNLIGTILPLGISLITIPIYIDEIGVSRYGVLAIAWLLLGYFGLFDLGLGRATAQRIAMLGKEKSAEKAETFWTALAMNSGMSVLGALLMWPVALYFFGHHFTVEGPLKPEILAAIPWLSLAVPIATMAGVLTGTLQGCYKFLELNIISVSGSILLQTIPLAVAVLVGPDLTGLIVATILTRTLVITLLFQRCYSYVISGFKYSVSKGLAGDLLRFGGWVTVSSVVGPMMVILDRFVIGALLGAKYVTFYTVPFQLGERSNIIPIALSSALFPRLAQAGIGPDGWMLADKAIKSLAVVITPLFLLGIFLMDWFLSIWIGREFADQASLVGQIILLGFWANAIARIPHALLQASGRPDVVAKCHLGEVLPYFALLYIGLHFFGISGAAIAFSIRAAVDASLLLYWAKIFKQSKSFLFFPIFLMCLGLILVRNQYAGWVWLTTVVAVFFTSVLWAIHNMPKEIKDIVARFIPLTVAFRNGK
ncbi:flippase [Desulfuromonas sp. AOP6]|uniref:flippase n=1 Tax=Desulfuromonas sp. AOP6 TaxID=1566351 RepID=UPI00127D2214|nr:flippase [Desulfuromonas sp. AOP6]BCA80097.1 polysaccharide biosynthesis protein [Desulfuromonas sp. AOP6]